jgi:hypothetical protein
VEYWFNCPEPGDKESWRCWIKVTAIAAAVGLIVASIFILVKL